MGGERERRGGGGGGGGEGEGRGRSKRREGVSAEIYQKRRYGGEDGREDKKHHLVI